MEPTSVELRTDPVGRMVCDLTPKEFVDWMVKYHGLPPESAKTVESNLLEQYKWHRLQGRLDRGWQVLSALAELVGLRQSPMVLEYPKKEEAVRP